MKRFSSLLIRLLGPGLYLKIPQRLRRRWGMICGEDMSDINELLRQIRDKCFEYNYERTRHE